jgi:hypothetical protein
MGPLGRAASGCWAGWCVGLVSDVQHVYTYKYIRIIYMYYIIISVAVLLTARHVGWFWVGMGFGWVG